MRYLIPLSVKHATSIYLFVPTAIFVETQDNGKYMLSVILAPTALIPESILLHVPDAIMQVTAVIVMGVCRDPFCLFIDCNINAWSMWWWRD